jgi:hypothetical protein
MSDTGNSEQFSLLAFKEELKEALQQPQQSRIPLFIAALAAFLSIISLADNETDKTAMSAHIEASNKFAYFQAKSIRMTDAEIAAKIFENMDQQDLAMHWRKKAKRYSKEKSDIIKEARQQQRLRADALLKGDYYKVGVTLLQIAIVLASASMVLGGGVLFAISIFLTVVSLVYSINGYGMFFEIPTDPVAMMDWIYGANAIVRSGLAI